MPGKEKESKTDKESTASKLVELEATIESLSGKVKKNSKDVKASIDSLNGKVTKNSTDIAANLRLIQKEKLEREIEALKGKFIIRGYEWQKATFTGRENSTRRKFIRLMARNVFVESQLMTFEEWKETEFPDCKPVFWDNKAGFSDKLTTPLLIQFGDLSLWHGIKAALNGKRDLVYQIREALPRILDKMYDDALRHRRTLLSAPSGGTRKLFIDIKPSEPYVQLVEKVMVDGVTSRKVVEVRWNDDRFRDPVANHDDFRSLPRPDAGGPNRGGYRGRGRGMSTPYRGRADDVNGSEDNRATRSSSRNTNVPRTQMDPGPGEPPVAMPSAAMETE
jgi:hypothetical protein